MLSGSSKSKRAIGVMAVAIVASGALASAAFSTPASAARRVRHDANVYSNVQSETDYNKSSQKGYGPAPTGQFPAFEELDHFPGSNNG